MCKADPFVKNSGTEGKCQRATSPQRRLSQAAGLAFGLEQAEDVVLTDCAQLVLLLAGGRRRGGGELRTSALDVADDGTGLVVHELDTALGDTTTGACMAVSLRFLRSPSILSRAAVWLSSIFFLHALPECGDRVPVRPRTRVTLTSLTGALADSILWDDVVDGRRSFGVDLRGGWMSFVVSS